MLRLLAILVLLIVYGSLYPWHFTSLPNGVGPAARYLLRGGGSLYLRDALVNVVLYVPVGACAFLAFRSRLRPFAAAISAIAFGTFLSIFVEVAQAYESSRRTSIYDVYTNCAGSTAGLAVASAFSQVSERLDRRAGFRVHDAGALLLLVCWIAYLLFPFLPATGPAMVAKLARSQTFSPPGFVSAVVTWFVIGNACEAAGLRRSKAWCLISVILVPAQILVLRRQPSWSEFAGALAGAVLFLFVFQQAWRYRAAAIAMLCLLALRGVAPLEWATQSKPFDWIPFASLLESEWYRGSQVLTEKVFFYAAAIWSLRLAGMRLRTATLATAAVLMLVEVSQLWLQRTPEITDSVLALLIGVGLDAFASEPKRTSSPFGTSA